MIVSFEKLKELASLLGYIIIEEHTIYTLIKDHNAVKSSKDIRELLDYLLDSEEMGIILNTILKGI